jgi:hypothetical protein
MPAPRPILIAVVFLVAVAALGALLGHLSVPPPPHVKPAEPTPGPDSPGGPGSPQAWIDPEAPPVFFHTATGPGANLVVAMEQVERAARAGVHQYVVDLPAPWNGEEDISAILNTLEQFIAKDSKAVFVLRIDLNPPDAWLQRNRGHAMHVNGQALRFPTTASALWQEEGKTALATLADTFDAHPMGPRVMGYVLAALDQGRWLRGGYDASPASIEGFRAWLGRRYASDAGLRDAWGDSLVTRAAATVPEPVDTEETTAVFYEPPAMRSHVDFLTYQSESAADAIAAFTVHLKAHIPPDRFVLAPYGYTFEPMQAHAGQFALGAIIDSDLDGIMGPVSYHDRGLGEPGSVVGPYSSVLLRGKRWFLIDDTRTGLAHDAASGKFTRMEGLLAEDVYHVQQRNFATAFTHGMGLIWSDPEGRGSLNDREQWQVLGSLRETYAQYRGGLEGAPEGQAPGTLPGWPERDRLFVVIDENSRAWQRCGTPLSESLFVATRAAATRCGLPVEYVLLQDVLDDRLLPPASVYLFLNAFALTDGERNQLHSILAREKATAIWMYAPGYLANDASVHNVEYTTSMRVKRFEEPGKSGSYFALNGRWARENEPFGITRTWDPLFYIEDSDADVLGRFAANDRVSLGVKFMEEGWTSVFCAEPVITAPVLRETLRILGKPNLFQDPAKATYDALYIAGAHLAIHARDSGERSLDFPGVHDIIDLLDPRVGWPQSGSIVVPMRSGETRLLQLAPIALPENTEGEADFAEGAPPEGESTFAELPPDADAP